VSNSWIPVKERFAQPTEARKLADVIGGADVFLGLSAGGVLKQDMVRAMASRPLIFALANPTPEILPDEVKAVRNDAVIATGRSDYPNQVNNVLCFPFIFRGALDVGATTITRQMEIAAVQAIADLAREEQSDVVSEAYGGIEDLAFGPDYLIPKPFDPRLIVRIAPAVARAAMDSGVATRPIGDFDEYSQRLQQFVYHSGTMMAPIFAAARKLGSERSRIVFAEGEDERVLRAVQIVVDEKLARPILVGRPGAIERSIKPVRFAPAHRRESGRRQSRVRQPLPRVLAGLPQAHRAQRRHRAIRQARDAPAHDADRRDAAEEKARPTA
jgi:malate dehydrogenase (oxaloacetate-decarboxylating)(NADP+)